MIDHFRFVLRTSKLHGFKEVKSKPLVSWVLKEFEKRRKKVEKFVQLINSKRSLTKETKFS